MQVLNQSLHLFLMKWLVNTYWHGISKDTDLKEQISGYRFSLPIHHLCKLNNESWLWNMCNACTLKWSRNEANWKAIIAASELSFLNNLSWRVRILKTTVVLVVMCNFAFVRVQYMRATSYDPIVSAPNEYSTSIDRLLPHLSRLSRANVRITPPQWGSGWFHSK